MEQSILKSTKKVLLIGDEDDSFDLDILTHINSAFSTLSDLGIGPEDGFIVEDDEVEWSDFLSDHIPTLSKVKIYVFLHTRFLFDPPTTSFLLNAMEKQVEECLWRISVQRETTDWVDPDPPLVVVDGE